MRFRAPNPGLAQIDSFQAFDEMSALDSWSTPGVSQPGHATCCSPRKGTLPSVPLSQQRSPRAALERGTSQSVKPASSDCGLGELMLKVAIITGSTRPGRKSEGVARWVYDIAAKRSDASFEV